MRYLITGAGGQLGKEWVTRLQEDQNEFAAFDSSDMDITDGDLVRKKIRSFEPDFVINCAAYTNVDSAEDYPELAFRVNAQGPEILAKECRKSAAKLIHYSTDYVFPGRESDAEKYPEGYPEDALQAPVNVYGKSKKEGEDAVRKYAGRYLVIRVSWLCGRYGDNFLKTMLRVSRERQEVRIVNDQIGSPSFCHDVVDKSLQLIELEQQGVYHVTSAGKISWYDFARKIFELNQTEVICKAVSSGEFSAKAVRPKFSLLNTAKIKDIGIQPVHWEKGTKELLQQLKNDL